MNRRTRLRLRAVLNKMGFDPSRLLDLLVRARQLFPRPCARDYLATLLAIALYALGPTLAENAAPLPLRLYRQAQWVLNLVLTARGLSATNPAHHQAIAATVEEVATAVGAGYRRPVCTDNRHSWNARWTRAVQRFAPVFYAAVERVSEFLDHATIPGYVSRSDDLHSDTWMLVARYLRGRHWFDCAARPAATFTLTFAEEPNADEIHAQLDAPAFPPVPGELVTTLSLDAGRFCPPEPLPIDSRLVLSCGAALVLTAPDGRAYPIPPRRPVRWLITEKAAIVRCGGPDAWQVRLRPGQAATLARPEGDTPVRLHTWTCYCGHCACQRRHRLNGWDGTVSLWNHASSAVTGPDVCLKVGSVLQGMYLPTLIQEDF